VDVNKSHDDKNGLSFFLAIVFLVKERSACGC
jgi:hypothetical protein